MVLYISPGRKVLLIGVWNYLFLKALYLSADFTAYYCVWVLHLIEFCTDTYVQLFKYLCFVICHIRKDSFICFQVLFYLFLYCSYICVWRMRLFHEWLFCSVFASDILVSKDLVICFNILFTLLQSINIDFHYL